MKTLSFEWDDQDEMVIKCDNAELVAELKGIKAMFERKAFLIANGWVDTKIDGVISWYYPENVREELELKVASHNFFYFQSDNIDVFSKGDKYLCKLEERLADEFSVVEAVALWNKYAPKELQKSLTV